MVRNPVLGLITLGLLAAAFMFTGCEQKSAEDRRNKILGTPAPCEADKECADGFICKDKTCQKGQRTAAELAAAKKAKADAKAAELAKKRALKPGEGRMIVRICPGFKNTPEAIGTITAVHQETKKKHLIHMAMEAPELGWQMEFTYWSLPLGVYDVSATYGIQKNGVADTVAIKCDPKAKPCRDETIREIEVVPPEKAPPKELDDKGKPKLKDCDFMAE